MRPLDFSYLKMLAARDLRCDSFSGINPVLCSVVQLEESGSDLLGFTEQIHLGKLKHILQHGPCPWPFSNGKCKRSGVSL